MSQYTFRMNESTQEKIRDIQKKIGGSKQTAIDHAINICHDFESGTSVKNEIASLKEEVEDLKDLIKTGRISQRATEEAAYHILNMINTILYPKRELEFASANDPNRAKMSLALAHSRKERENMIRKNQNRAATNKRKAGEGE